jgi:hypothetical protein
LKLAAVAVKSESIDEPNVEVGAGFAKDHVSRSLKAKTPPTLLRKLALTLLLTN